MNIISLIKQLIHINSSLEQQTIELNRLTVVNKQLLNENNALRLKIESQKAEITQGFDDLRKECQNELNALINDIDKIKFNRQIELQITEREQQRIIDSYSYKINDKKSEYEKLNAKYMKLDKQYINKTIDQLEDDDPVYLSSTISEDLDAVDILMLHYAPNFHTGKNSFQQFWVYRYGVDPKYVISKLLRMNLIEIGSYESSLKHLTMPELKEILKKFSLKTTGKKDELVNRIIASVDNSQFKKLHIPSYYERTATGEFILNNNPNILIAHRHPEYEIDIDDARTCTDINKKIENDLDNKEEAYIQNNSWGLYRNCRQQRAELCEKKKDYSQAICHYVEVLYIDLSGLRNGVDPARTPTFKEDTLRSWGNPRRILPTGIIKRIRSSINKANLDDIDLRNICSSAVYGIYLPYHFFTEAEAIDIIMDAIR